MRNPTPLGWVGLALLTAQLAGCLPSSCNRSESRSLFPADSTSRALASTLPIDTLEVVVVIASRDSLELKYPRTVAFADDGTLWVSDTESNRVMSFNDDQTTGLVVDASDFPYPYIAGFHGDTLLVLSPQSRQIVSILDGIPVGTVALPDDVPEQGAYQYAAASADHIYFKTIAENFDGYVVQLTSSGRVTERWDLIGEYWRFAGLLRVWGSSVLSLSGYRPVVHVMSDAPTVDTLALSGFDSPMLARSRRFVIGDLAVPPLLTASAAAAGEYLFVLNMRPGWLRVDVYGRDGGLRNILTQPSPEFNQNYYPTDIAARVREDGTFDLAVALIEPEARIERYLWRPRDGAPNRE